jgi:hypothetical protein
MARTRLPYLITDRKGDKKCSACGKQFSQLTPSINRAFAQHIRDEHTAQKPATPTAKDSG